ncbi:MAG: hypothetical protein J6W75_12275, partial [Bacteroidaceae bacterium]|nr:hypothetical protein [Bacteroidaceae bacterium]
MKRFILRGSLLCALSVLSSMTAFSSSDITIRFIDKNGAPILRARNTLDDVIHLMGTGSKASVTVSATGLTQDINLSVGPGFEVTPKTIPAGTETADVIISHTSTLLHTESQLILRSGDLRTYVNIIAEGTPLPCKDISSLGSVFDGSAVESQSFDAAALSDAGYTIEIKARTDDPSKSVLPYAVTASGLGFKSYIRSTSMGLMNGK